MELFEIELFSYLAMYKKLNCLKLSETNFV